MNLDELRSVQSKERQTDSLQHLRESFYGDVSTYVNELEAQRESAAAEAEDPFADPEVRRLTDEIETAREVVEAVYERRLGKLVKRASLAAAGMPTDDDGLTAEERELFDDLVERMEANKARVLDVLDADDPAAAGDAGTGPGAGTEPPADPAADDTGADRDAVGASEAEAVASPEGDGDQPPAESMPGAGDGPSGDDASSDGTDEHGSVSGTPADDAAERPDGQGIDTRTTVRITGEVDEFYGVDDREYDLDAEDVVTLPEENAEPLLQSGDAERVD